MVLTHVQVLPEIAQFGIIPHQDARLRQVRVIHRIDHDLIIRGCHHVRVRRQRLVLVHYICLSFTFVNLNLQAAAVIIAHVRLLMLLLY